MIIVLHYRKKIVKPAETDFTGFWFLFFFCHSIQFIQILFFHSFYTKIIYKKKYTIFCWLWLRDDRKKYIKFQINGKVGAGFWFCSLALATFLLLQLSLSRTWLLSTNVAKQLSGKVRWFLRFNATINFNRLDGSMFRGVKLFFYDCFTIIQFVFCCHSFT